MIHSVTPVPCVDIDGDNSCIDVDICVIVPTTFDDDAIDDTADDCSGIVVELLFKE